MFLKSADETQKLEGLIDMLKGRTAIHRDLDMLEEWADRNLTKFDMNKCKALHKGRKNPAAMGPGWALPGWRATLLKKPWGFWQTAR